MNAIVHKTCGTIARNAGQKTRARLDPSGETVQLRRREHMQLADAAGWTVTVLSGSAWITQDGDIRDVVLDAGQSAVLDRNGPAIVSALGDTCLRLSNTGAIKASHPANLRRLFTASAHASFA